MRTKIAAALAVGLLSLGAAATATFGQDAARVQPGSYRVLVDNRSVRVLEYNGLPGMGVCGSGVHSHPAHLTVLLTPARVRIIDHGHVILANNKAGDVFWSEAVTHETENIGGANVRSLIIELKNPVRGR